MKTIVLTLFAFGIAFAQTSTPAISKATNKPAPPAKTKSATPNKSSAAADPNAKPQPPVQSIPAGAKLVEPNLYQYTDSNGKTWNYRQTPFGISKWEETSSPSAQSQSQPAQAQPQTAQPKAEPVMVTDLGDSYKFEKNTPFGRSSWVRKKSDLSDEERNLVAGQQTSAPAANSKPEGN